MAVKDFTEDVIRQRVAARQKAREEARKEAEQILAILRFPDSRLFIDANEEEVHPVQLMMGLVSQHIEMLENTITQLIKEIEKLELRIKELEGTNIVVPNMAPPKDLVQ
jgi:hypothetical protein